MTQQMGNKNIKNDFLKKAPRVQGRHENIDEKGHTITSVLAHQV